MSSGIPADIVDAVKERSRIRIRDVAREIIQRQMRSDGTTFGDIDLSRGDRILRFQDYASRGVLDALRVVKPELLDRMIKQQLKDLAVQTSKEVPEAPPRVGY